MKTIHTVFVAFTLSVVGPVFAGGGPYPLPAIPESGFVVKSGAQVRAEAREAMRLGLINLGEGDQRVATHEQERLIADAGRRVAEREMIAKHNVEANK